MGMTLKQQKLQKRRLKKLRQEQYEDGLPTPKGSPEIPVQAREDDPSTPRCRKCRKRARETRYFDAGERCENCLALAFQFACWNGFNLNAVSPGRHTYE
jgi:hypothetical protein